MPEYNLVKLQRVQNTLARVVLKVRKFDHITPTLKELRWLPVKHRVTFQIATLTFKTLKFGQPTYLRDLINIYEPTRTLRSSSQQLISKNRTRTVVATRAFKHSSSAIWNNLPVFIRGCNSVDNFKHKLKTHLFKLAYI